MILLHELYRDFINLAEYTEIQEKIKKNRQLFAELINLNMVYDYNESKFRDNLNIFIQQTEVLKCTEQISIDTCNNRIPVKFTDDLFQYDSNHLTVLTDKISSWERLKINFLTYIYTKLVSLNYNEYFESLFFLFSTFKSKNRNIVSEQEFDLNSFLKNESDEMFNTVNQTV